MIPDFPIPRPVRLPFLTACALAISVAAARPEAAAPKAGGPAPDFTLPDLLRDRNEVSLKSLRGRVVVMDFWASWCPPCRKTLPRLGRMRIRRPSLVVLAVSIDEQKAKAVEFLTPRDTSVVFLHDAKREVASRYDPGGMPSLMVIDRKGVLRYRHDGYTEGDVGKIEEEIGKLMEEP